MKIENGRIIEATVNELYEYYLTRDWWHIMSFGEFRFKMENLGCVVTEKEKSE